MAEGSKNDVRSFAAGAAGSVGGAVGCERSGGDIGQLGMASGRDACGFSWSFSWSFSWGCSETGVLDGSSGSSNSSAVCVAPTTMMATLAAISTVLTNRSARVLRGSGRSSAASCDMASAGSAGWIDGAAASSGGSLGRFCGGCCVGASGRFLNGHLSKPPTRGPSPGGTFTGVSR